MNLINFRYFQKIHYFGRARQRFLGMSEDIREMMSLITAMRRKKQGGKVTWNDLKAYMESGDVEALFGPDGRRAFVPRNIHLWRFVDDNTSGGLSTLRRLSALSTGSDVSSAEASLTVDEPGENGSVGVRKTTADSGGMLAAHMLKNIRPSKRSMKQNQPPADV